MPTNCVTSKQPASWLIRYLNVRSLGARVDDCVGLFGGHVDARVRLEVVGLAVELDLAAAGHDVQPLLPVPDASAARAPWAVANDALLEQLATARAIEGHLGFRSVPGLARRCDVIRMDDVRGRRSHGPESTPLRRRDYVRAAPPDPRRARRPAARRRRTCRTGCAFSPRHYGFAGGMRRSSSACR